MQKQNKKFHLGHQPSVMKSLQPELLKATGNPTNIVSMSPGLVAIALLIKARHGPRFVFHYPAQPCVESSHEMLYGTDMNPSKLDPYPDYASDESEESLYTSFNHINLNQTNESKKDINDNRYNFRARFDRDEHFNTPNGIHIVPWENFFEFSTTDLESILTPSRAYHKSRFEMILDPLCFLTYPVHIREDGRWKKRTTQKLQRTRRKVASSRDIQNRQVVNNERGDEDNISEDSDDGGMTMFNAVFILDVSKYDLKEKASEMYEHVVKTFNRALLETQANSGYVWNESELILAMKEKAREDRRPMSWLWREILLRSTLACAMKEIFNSISQNKIATCELGPNFNISLQIPKPSFLMSLPTAREPAIPGLFVTSADPMLIESRKYDESRLNKNFALLLTEDESKLLTDMHVNKTELSEALTECIRLCKPTLSFAQVAQINSIELTSLLTLASHLIFYRRALAIPPLHLRNTYIVSPNCDCRKLPNAIKEWKEAFPTAPSLRSFLSALSTDPRPYKTFLPSRDHRLVYIEMLSWLIRGGWVTQLRTFAWIQVWPEIQYEVHYRLKAEAIEKAKHAKDSSQDDTNPKATDDSGSDDILINSNLPLTTEQVAEQARLRRLAEKMVKQEADEAMAFAKLPTPIATTSPSSNNASHLEVFPAPYIIIDPEKATYEESLFIAAIATRLINPRMQDLWPGFTKYFNGNCALESIALEENMKRKETWHVLLGFQEHLLICRHW
ncbi:BgTH12-00125 [Blumeria graminis f. sp. triticale]|uniref:Nitrogen permease regulator 3 n=3 Tax=Blumeria graminis TaxID=34373 RepID=A0A061HFY3_BLUGR|nr:hypothetical protein BGT96224_5257 [Blumeria graminis f. sp. tritici 96224]CAD6504617.1 BgTH12-00125 [Blumeria graminis f. sp. triticale]VDB92648.1 Bgt-5257 [Blumeria graminis f. sp. tritici]